MTNSPLASQSWVLIEIDPVQLHKGKLKIASARSPKSYKHRDIVMI